MDTKLATASLVSVLGLIACILCTVAFLPVGSFLFVALLIAAQVFMIASLFSALHFILNYTMG